LFELSTKKEKSLGLKLSVRSAHCSPVADKLVFMADLGNGSIQDFTCNLDGTDVRQITFGPGKAYNPLWSKDGKHIVFFRELGDQKDQICLMNPDGTNLRRLSESSMHNFYPDFGPGRVISYTVANGEKDKRIVICNDRGKVQSVFPYRTSRLRWSPDGKLAIFATGEFPMTALYVSNANGSNPRRVGKNR
jgi:Tol biopolymer transport system component